MILLLGLALAAHLVVHEGDTVESLVEGDEARARALREANGLGPGEQPAVGRILDLPAHGEASVPAAVLSFYGSAAAWMPDGSSTQLSVGLPLPPGTLVCTQEGGFTTLRLAVSDGGHDHDDVSLLPGTCLRIEALAAEPSQRSSLVSIEKGSITVRSAEDPTPGEVTVRTPTGVSTGTGGGFRVHVEAAGSSRTEALYNPVAVMGAGAEVRLKAGEGVRVQPGRAPGRKVQLPPPGSPLLPEAEARLLVPDFSWTPVPEALGYRVELAVSPDFSEVVLYQDVPDDHWNPDLLLLPYRVPGAWWRVTSFDRLGFMGLPSEARPMGFPQGVGP